MAAVSVDISQRGEVDLVVHRDGTGRVSGAVVKFGMDFEPLPMQSFGGQILEVADNVLRQGQGGEGRVRRESEKGGSELREEA